MNILPSNICTRRVFAVFTKHSNQILNFVWTFLEDNGKKKIVLPWMNLYDPFHAKRTKNACSVHKRHTLSLNLIHYIASRQEFKIPYRIAKSPYTMYWNSFLRSTILIFMFILALWKKLLWFSYYLHNSVMRVGSDTFGDPIFQNGLQN